MALLAVALLAAPSTPMPRPHLPPPGAPSPTPMATAPALHNFPHASSSRRSPTLCDGLPLPHRHISTAPPPGPSPASPPKGYILGAFFIGCLSAISIVVHWDLYPSKVVKIIFRCFGGISLLSCHYILLNDILGSVPKRSQKVATGFDLILSCITNLVTFIITFHDHPEHTTSLVSIVGYFFPLSEHPDADVEASRHISATRGMIPLEDALGTPETDDFIAVLTHEPQVPQFEVSYLILQVRNGFEIYSLRSMPNRINKARVSSPSDLGMAAEVDAAAPGGGEGAGGVRSRCGRGALHLAAANGRTHVCRFLLEGLGLPVDALSASGETPLLLAATFGHTSTAAYLLDRGADPSTPDPNGGDTPLHWAAYNGDRELAKLLLLRGADVGAANPRGTALHVAAARGHAAVVSVLLNHGADPNKIANIVFTPLVSSLLGGSLECMKLLIQAGANVNGAGFNGATPLLLACSRTGSIGFIKCLVESGADPNIPDELDRLPIEIAAIHAEREVIEVLLPLTHQVPTLLDWSVGGIIRYVKYPAYKEWARNASCKRKDELKLQGNSAFNNEDYDAAILLYSMAMKFDNTDAKLYSNRSACWLNLGIGDEALSDAQICSKMQPDWAKGYYRQGMAFSLLQDYASASYVLRRALKLDPQNATVAKALRCYENKIYMTENVLEKRGDVLETACPRMEESGLAFVHQKKRDWSPAAAGRSVPDATFQIDKKILPVWVKIWGVPRRPLLGCGWMYLPPVNNVPESSAPEEQQITVLGSE
uniref:DUF4220 domain-containing protein n=1 Tax=Oryza barthii TaxID=65489 RepID=A0A0D3EK39_9ORYZ